MNFITFASRADALSASTHLELSGAPAFVVCDNEIHSNDINTVIDLLTDSGISFDSDRDDEHDPFRTDAEADADALASAGMGTDEDYEHNSYDEGGDY